MRKSGSEGKTLAPLLSGYAFCQSPRSFFFDVPVRKGMGGRAMLGPTGREDAEAAPRGRERRPRPLQTIHSAASSSIAS